jgi:hypothetical protein
MRANRILITALLVAALVALPATAFGSPGTPGVENAATSTYIRPGVEGEDVGQPNGTGTPQVAPAEELAAVGDGDGGGLPFTGLSAALILGVGAGAVGVGLAVRMLSRVPNRT